MRTQEEVAQGPSGVTPMEKLACTQLEKSPTNHDKARKWS